MIRLRIVRGDMTPQGRDGSHLCHCEEHSDEAISIADMGDCFASLAMTCKAALSNGFPFALLSKSGWTGGASADKLMGVLNCLCYRMDEA